MYKRQDFNLVQFKNKAENMLVSALQAIDSGNVSLIRDASEELKAQDVYKRQARSSQLQR